MSKRTTAMSKQYPVTMKSKVGLPPPGRFVKANEFSRRSWRRIQHIANEFWVRWHREFLWSLQTRRKWNKKCRNFQQGDIALLTTEANRNQWLMAKVIEVNVDDLGFVRSVRLLLASSCDSAGERVLEWPIHKIVLIKEVEVWFPDEEIWCQDGLTTWGEPVVIVSKEERHCFDPVRERLVFANCFLILS